MSIPPNFSPQVYALVMPLLSNQHERFVQKMFDRIAGHYDLLNRVISFHLDTIWRREAIKALRLKGTSGFVLDLGTGTGDLALIAAKEMGKEGKVFGLDLSPQMLRLAQKKRRKLRYGDKTVFVLGSALAPPFRSETYETVITAFVLRNIADLNLFFLEAYRLLRPGGKLASLDMFPPTGGPFSLFYSYYFYRLVPWIGSGLAGDRTAYQYLSDSVKKFASPESIADVIRQAGFEETRIQRFLRGAVCLHMAEKPQRK
ncbi:MAG: ubiquinone/menaquinone biosynthesis methyltransferase [Candidatus Binatia bacterium]